MALSESQVDSCPVQPTYDGTNHQSNQVVECPFGFGRRGTKAQWEQAIAPLCCPLCRALLYEAQRAVPCGHCYCQTCSNKVKDCLLCAADIQEFTGASEVDSDVESFIQAHSHNIELLQDEQASSTQTESESDVLLKKSTFLLYQALKAQKSGNYASALARLRQADLDLKDKNEQRYVNRRSIVLGKIGDILCSKNELDQAAEYVEQACKLSEEANVTDEQPAGKEALGILSTSHAKAGDIYTLLEQDELAISHYSKAIGAKEKLARLVSSEEPSGILQKALLLTKLAEILQRAARKRAYDAKTLMDSLRQCDQSSVSERDQNVVEYVSSSIASILGSGE